MIFFNQNDVIERFAVSFNGLAAIRDHYGKYLLTNPLWESMVGSKTGQSITDVHLCNTSPELIATSLKHCQQSDASVIYHNHEIYQFEFFNNKRYATIRIPVEYRGHGAILIMGVICK